MSFKPVFQVGSDPKFYDNAQRFATREEARGSSFARFQVWTIAASYDVQESDDPVNYCIVDGRDTPLREVHDTAQ